MPPGILLLVLLASRPAPARASELHVESFGRYGGSTWLSTFSGSISGAADVPTGSGMVERTSGGLLLGEASLPFEHSNLDLSFTSLKYQTRASGFFAFNGDVFDGRAGLDFRATIGEAVYRYRILERPHLALHLMGGGRLMSTDVEVFGVDLRTVATETFFLPEVGAAGRLTFAPGWSVYTVFKWFDYGRRDAGNHTLESVAGLAYHAPPRREHQVGFRASAGYRFLNLEARTRVGSVRESAFDVTFAGPYLAFASAF